MIYAMRGCTGCGPAFKIGRSTNPKARVASLQTGSAHSIELLALLDWPDDIEQLIHDAFADLRVSGEWFHLDDYLSSFISTMACPNGATDEEKYALCMRVIVDRFLKRPCDGRCRAPDKREAGD